jgi:hypothetical protein
MMRPVRECGPRGRARFGFRATSAVVVPVSGNIGKVLRSDETRRKQTRDLPSEFAGYGTRAIDATAQSRFGRVIQ